MKKEYRTIANYDDCYIVYNNGVVKSLDRYVYHKLKNNKLCKHFIKGRVLKHIINNKGYHLVNLCKDGVGKRYLVSRLVASAFIPNPNNYLEVDHINENKDDNSVTNLRWCTRQFNNTRGIQSREGREKTCEFRMKKIGMYDKDGNLLRTYKGIRIAERDTGFNNANISYCCRMNKEQKGHLKNNHSYKGYIWRYL